MITTLTLEEYQSICYSHMHEDINVDDVLDSLQVLQPLHTLDECKDDSCHDCIPF